MNIKGLDELPIEEGSRVFIRVDFNTPLSKDTPPQITDDTRIQAALPTIQYCLKKNACVVLASHLGRPKGKFVEKYSLEPVASRLAELLGKDVLLTDEPVGDGAKKLVLDLREGQVLLLENLRFDPGEAANDEIFSQALASYCDVYINDAFGTAHRAHASTVGIAALAESCGAGLLLQSEIKALSRLLDSPESPYVAIVGGAKVSDKIQVLESLLQPVDTLLIGGAMANTFLVAQGRSMGASLVETEKLEMARSFLRKADHKGVKVVLPVDVVVAPSFDSNQAHVVGVGELTDEMMALDIGPETRKRFERIISGCRSLFWNGPMGVFEKEAFAQGTLAVAHAVAANTKAFTVVGGGDSVAAIHKAKVAKSLSHISTGGGASLEFIQGKVLPGILALDR